MKKISNILIVAVLLLAAYWLYFGAAAKKAERSDQIKEKITVKVEKEKYIPIKKDGVPNILAKNWILMDADSGTIITGKDYNKKVPIASITKLMTALLARDNLKLTDTVKITKDDVSIIGSKMNLRRDEVISVEGLLNGLLITSGNDAAHALARKIGAKNEIGGNEKNPIENFVVLMNKKAQSLGLKNTFYKDPAGLDDATSSSAKDQALLISKVLKDPVLSKITRKPETTVYSQDGSVSHNVKNSDRLVKDEMYFPGIIGGKTGFTPQAGHNLAVYAGRNGHRLVAVVINTYSQAPSASAKEAKKLLEWGFENTEWIKVGE